MAVKKGLNSIQRDDLESDVPDHNEMIIVELKQSDGNCLGILSFYRPPNDLNFDFCNNFERNLDSMWNDGLQEMLVCGDLNFSEIDWDSGYPVNINGLAFKTADLFQDFGLTQHNSHPSREENNNILDVKNNVILCEAGLMLIIFTKNYIHICKCVYLIPNVHGLKNYIKDESVTERRIYERKQNLQIYLGKWDKINQILYNNT